jgi:hypothetical protein
MNSVQDEEFSVGAGEVVSFTLIFFFYFFSSFFRFRKKSEREKKYDETKEC